MCNRVGSKCDKIKVKLFYTNRGEKVEEIRHWWKVVLGTLPGIVDGRFWIPGHQIKLNCSGILVIWCNLYKTLEDDGQDRHSKSSL